MRANNVPTARPITLRGLTVVAVLAFAPLVPCQASLMQSFSWDDGAGYVGTAVLEFNALTGDQTNLVSCTASGSIGGNAYNWGGCSHADAFTYSISVGDWTISIEPSQLGGAITWDATNSATSGDFQANLHWGIPTLQTTSVEEPGPTVVQADAPITPYESEAPAPRSLTALAPNQITPAQVPEPGPFVLVTLGLVALAFGRKRRVLR